MHAHHEPPEADAQSRPLDPEAVTPLAVDLMVRLGILMVLAVWCFVIFRPFIVVLMWAAVLAIALYPVFVWLRARLGGRAVLAAVLLTILGLAVLAGPVSLLVGALIGEAETLARRIAAGELGLPPPPAQIAGWPLIGPPLSRTWALATTNLEAALVQIEPELRVLATALLGFAASAGLALLQFLAATLVAGLFMVKAEPLTAMLRRFGNRVAPRQGDTFVPLMGATVRNVARGVVGVAALQSLLLGIGFVAAGIPAAGILTVLSFVLSVVQIGPTIVVVPALVYAWLSLDVLTALLFTVWLIPVAFVDNVLKPIVMSRGLTVPMLVIFVGVIGGTLAHGIIGLFVGPVVLALGYTLLQAWLHRDARALDSGEPAPP